ncbi:hypothetical protein TIFTF001_028707 [Ficus carica]|uniref:Ubiquitin-like protease family profile domain-containing protein n=1 Tax=Ficus carica TaxID=3494 RepID=A0AA88DQG1_FICCA|nr:hypothetical protein TIFTF001_028707 [Ficus carica]
MNEKGQGKAPTTYHVSSRQKMNDQTDESDALKTTSNDLGSSSQDDVFIDSDIGAVADMGVQAAIEFLTANKKDVEKEKERPSVECYKGEKNKEKFKEHLEGKEGEAKIPKQKRSRLSRLGQRRSGPMTEVGSPSHASSKLIYALPLGLADEPPKDKLDEFREWINIGLLKRTPPGKRPPRYNAKYETLVKPHDLGFMAYIDVAFYYLRKKIMQFPELVQRKVTTVDTFVSAKHEGPHKFKVREALECMSKFIPLLADRISLFEFKLREPPGIYPIPVTIMKDIPQQANGGDCGMFTTKYDECLIEGRDVLYWVTQGLMQIFREWLTCYLWCHAKRKIEQTYKSDDDEDMDF